MDKKRIALGIIALLVIATIILDQTGTIAKLGSMGAILTFSLICLAVIAFAIWLNNKAVLTASIVFSFILIFSKLVGLGFIALPSGTEWYFKALDLVIPSIVLGIVLWQKKHEMLFFAIPMLVSFLVYFAVNIGLLSFAWSWAFFVLFACSVLVLIWLSSSKTTVKTMAWFFSLLGVIAMLAIILLTPIGGPYTIAWFVLGLIGSSFSAFLLILGRGGICAVAAIILSLAMPVGLACLWISQGKDILIVIGLAMVAVSMAPQKKENL